MNVEELHAFFAPAWQFVSRHQRPGNLAGGADLVDGETDLVDDGLRRWSDEPISSSHQHRTA